jgi:hypothetical protein
MVSIFSRRCQRAEVVYSLSDCTLRASLAPWPASTVAPPATPCASQHERASTAEQRTDDLGIGPESTRRWNERQTRVPYATLAWRRRNRSEPALQIGRLSSLGLEVVSEKLEHNLQLASWRDRAGAGPLRRLVVSTAVPEGGIGRWQRAGASAMLARCPSQSRSVHGLSRS